MIKAVTFDLWNTLFDNKSYTHIRLEMFKDFILQKGIQKEDEEIEDAYKFAFSFSNEILGKTNFRHNYVKDRIAAMFNKLKISLSDSEINDLIDANEIIMLDDYPPLKKGSVELLEQLSTKYRVGLISDTGITPGRIIKKVFEEYGILQYFTTTLFSDETGFYKPCYVMFEKAMKNLKSIPRNSIHVGDLLETDIKGANDYNIYSVWLNELQSPNPTEITPDFEIDDIVKLPSIINKIEEVDT